MLACFVYLQIPSSFAAPSIESRRQKIETMENKVSPEALQRKQKSELILKNELIPVNQYLPVIESELESKKRTKDEVAMRALSLIVMAAKGAGLEQTIALRIIKEYGLSNALTPKEKVFLANNAPSKNDLVQFSWRYEAAWVLLWALSFVDKLEMPTQICDVNQAVAFMKERDTKKFTSDAKLRKQSELLDQADRIYRYHWAIVDARIKNKAAPGSLKSSVVLERHYALNWLIGYMDQDWDDISTDT
jgi:Domain of unknown function (DUF4272)